MDAAPSEGCVRLCKRPWCRFEAANNRRKACTVDRGFGAWNTTRANRRCDVFETKIAGDSKRGRVTGEPERFCCGHRAAKRVVNVRGLPASEVERDIIDE
jgi:hypothetical protein